MLDWIDTGLDFISDKLGGLGDSIVGGILSALDGFVGKLMYYVTKAVMYLVWVLQSLFNVFAGLVKVQSGNSKQYLINVFFSNSTINNVYWAMALLGITFVIAFTIIAVIRKGFDLNDKRQNQTMGSILSGMFKSILTMLLLTSIMSAALSLTNEVIHRVSYIFDNADSFDQEDEIHFTDEQFATMARIYKTIGNYSLNPSYGTRYNLNSCYNELRPDLLFLQQQGVFDFVYATEDPVTGETIDTWQSVLQELVYASDVTRELNINVYHEEVSEVLLHIMDILRTNRSFYPLEEYGRSYTANNSVGLDRILFLTGTTSAARNQNYNINPHMTDGLRGAFYLGEKNIYSFDDVTGAFDTGITGINYILIWVLAYFTLRNLLRCIFACISRIFNMVSLYVVAPLTIATMPLDDGEKFKQWTITMTIQGLVIFGNIIPMRLIILFAPIILSPQLVLFESTSLNFIAKALLIVGGLEAVEGFSHIVTGILANSSGMAAINGDTQMRDFSDKVFGAGVSAAKTTGKAAAKLGWAATKGAAIAGGVAAAGGLAAAGLAVGGIGAGLYHGARGLGHVGGKLYDYISDRKANSKLAAAAKEANQKNSEPQYASTGFGQSPLGGGSGSGQMIEMTDLSNTQSDKNNATETQDDPLPQQSKYDNDGPTLDEEFSQVQLNEAPDNFAQSNEQAMNEPPESDFQREDRERFEREQEEAYREAKRNGTTIPKDSPYYSEKYDPPRGGPRSSVPDTSTNPVSQMAGGQDQGSSLNSRPASSGNVAGGTQQTGSSNPSPASGNVRSSQSNSGGSAGSSQTQSNSGGGTSSNMPGTRVKAGTDPLSSFAKAPSGNKSMPPLQNYNKK